MATRRRAPAQAPLFAAPADDPAVAWSVDLGGPVAGLDEAGRGPLAGPVVAAAVVLPSPLPEALAALNDSKKLDEAQREALHPLIQQHALAYGVAEASPAVIDAKNILGASLWAMAQALEACERMLGEEIKGALIDGNQKAPLPPRVRQRTLVKGDSLSRPIMAASILAKVHRDRLMVAAHDQWPAYGFDVHKGYPTPTHLKSLAEQGPCPIHRRSFAPVKAALEAEKAVDVAT